MVIYNFKDLLINFYGKIDDKVIRDVYYFLYFG